MTIDLITKELHKELTIIYTFHPELTFNNKGYQYIKESSLKHVNIEAFKRVTEILNNHIHGFVKFNNFRDGKGFIELRFQYNYSHDSEDRLGSFTGVGYIKLDELLKGFDK